MYDQNHPAYRKLQEIGREITTKVKPRAVVVFSAHWQASRDTVEVNNAEITELIYEYDFFHSPVSLSPTSFLQPESCSMPDSLGKTFHSLNGEGKRRWLRKEKCISACPELRRKIIHSFYGFPSHYYEEKFPNVGSRQVAQKVIDAIRGAGMKAEGVKRGLDHGVWASFKCGRSSMFNSFLSPSSGLPL